MSALSEFLEKVPDGQRALVRSLDSLIAKAAPGLSTSLKWGNLTYHASKNVCALISHKGYLNLQLWGGASLEDPAGLLAGTGKDMRHIRLEPGSEIDAQSIAELVKQASQLGAG